MKCYINKLKLQTILLQGLMASFSLLITLSASGQIKEEYMRSQVLKNNNIGHEFVFKNKDHSITHLTYLGTITSTRGIHYKIMNSIWVWGDAHRATSRILVFGKNDSYLGNYPLTLIDDLPSYIKGNELVFINKQENNVCNPRSITRVNFNNGIPNEFFRKCNGKEGDVYTFNKD